MNKGMLELLLALGPFLQLCSAGISTRCSEPLGLPGQTVLALSTREQSRQI